VTIPGYTPGVDEDTTSFGQIVGPRFFETMRVPLLEGRDFGDAEMVPVERGGRATAVINEAMARRFFGESSPVGRTLTLQNKAPLEIVGVAKGIKYRSLREETMPTFYVSAFQYPGFGGMIVVVRAAAGRISAETFERAVRELDPQTQVMSVRTMQAVIDEAMTTERFVARLAGVFGLFALLLASIGLFGIMSYIVARRTNEFAVRVALGARREQIVAMAVRETLVLTAWGFTIGLPAAFAAARLVKTMLYGVSAIDQPTAAATALVMLVVSALAACVPARRAARVDPMVALRCE
jgi:predicted permease